MPANQGYLWKGVYCFGEKPAQQGNNYQITENKKGVKIIIRWDKDYERIYEKPSRQREKLISEKKRKKKV